MPEHWNGTLLLYSHGYRPSSASLGTRDAEPSLGWASGQTTAQRLLSQGYALAGSASASDGWAVAEGVAAGEELYRYFTRTIGTPKHVYAWGDSLGGLVSVELAELHPDVVSGAASVCGVLAGPVANLDLALDVAYAVKTLIWPDLRLVNFESAEDASNNLAEAIRQLQIAVQDPSGLGAAKIAFIAALVDAPAKTRTYDAHDGASMLGAALESVVTLLGVSTKVRAEIEARVGGNPSTNMGVNYALRISDSELLRLDAVDRGRTEEFVAALQGGTRLVPDPAARTRAAEMGTLTGDLAAPVLTVHTEDDPLVLQQNESWYAQRVGRQGRGADLRQFMIAPPVTYSEAAGAPYGAGHCNVTTSTVTGMITLLNAWVTRGTVPTGPAAAAAFGDASGLDVTAIASPWPDSTTR